MIVQSQWALAHVEQRVCDVASQALGILREQVAPGSRLVEDLGCDSLDLVELLMELEETFAVILPSEAPNPVYKAVFTRQPFRLADLAELIYLQQGTGTPERGSWKSPQAQSPAISTVPFSQLGGTWPNSASEKRLFEPLTAVGPTPQFRRRSDGMRCVLIPTASVEVGCDGSDADADERPCHVVHLDAFLMDAEPVSTTAYCRFLNSVGPVRKETLADWFILDPLDDRNEHVVIVQVGDEWQPIPRAERWPMILVSWYGANAYSLWANGQDWTGYRDEGAAPGSFLPTEAQWEYAARGARSQTYPWGEGPPAGELLRYGRHRRRATYGADTLPLAAVNDELGMSPFGLHHMAGNVWQWCRDWYDDGFYRRPEATAANPVNRKPTPVRSERGGSWVGPADLCRSSYRRGRPPTARGRCLGFRCVGSVEAARESSGHQ